MGNQRFTLSDMVPNAAWFYKLKEMVKLSTKNQNPHKITSNKKTHAISSSYSSLSSSSQNADNNSDELAKIQPHLSEQRKSYYFTRDLTLHSNPPPRRSSTRRRSTQRRARPHDTHPSLVSSSISSGWGCRSAVLTFSDNGGASADTIPSCGDRKTEVAGGGAPDFDHRDLPRIITKKQQSRSGVRRVSGNPSSSPGVKLRTNTPRVGNRRGRRRSVSESFAVVKSSRDPGRDFRESMVEMIVEHNLRGTTDLEELLACYLSLNADEYHHLIIAAFKQIWFDFIRFRPN